MEVQCERCGTRYEFSDALVSGHGTPVRCTNCGHQFRVRRVDSAPPSGAGGAEDDPWLIHTAQGQELALASFRELQHAILTGRVGAEDTLFRPGTPPQRLAAIVELEPLLEARRRQANDAAEGSPMVGTIPPMRGKVDTLRPPFDSAAAPPPPPDAAEGLPIGPFAEASDASAEVPTVVPPALDSGGPLLPPTVPVRRVRSVPVEDVYDGPGRSPFPSLDDAVSTRAPRRVGGWVVAAVLLGVVGVVGWLAARPYLKASSALGETPADPRVPALLANGEREISTGDREGATEDFDKASALAEHDPRVLLDQAKLAAIKADVPWLKSRLLSGAASEETRITAAQLGDLAARARRLAEAARAAAPDDVAAIGAQVDALRVSGAQDAARALVARITSQASQPTVAYVLAALDLAEPEPVWTTVLDRLRLAASPDVEGGRAEAALVYALAKSGDRDAANAELEKMDRATRPFPLLPALHALVAATPKGRSSEDAGDSEAAAPPRATASGLSSDGPSGSGPRTTPVRRAPAVTSDAPLVGMADPRIALQVAVQAQKRGDTTKARQIYESIVAKNPSDSEALAGLGDVARARGDTPGAVAAYRRALAVNPSYLPALLGLADTEWAVGDRAVAAQAYGDIVERFPDGTYPSYVADRATMGSSQAGNTVVPLSSAQTGQAAPMPSSSTSEVQGPSSASSGSQALPDPAQNGDSVP